MKKRSAIFMINMLLSMFMIASCDSSGGNTTTKTLRDLADNKNIKVGAAVNDYYLSYETAYSNTVAAEFNTLVPENVMKWDTLEPAQNVFNYSKADTIVQFAANNNMYIRGHTLLWHAQLPGWVKSAASTNRNNLQSILENHIQNVLTKYKGKIYAWDVVNEVVKDDGSGLRCTTDATPSIWAKNSTDDSLIIAAFNKAHAVDPDAKLFINDYSNEQYGNAKANKLYQLVAAWVSAGVPIHGVGFQLHLLEESPPDMQKVRQNIERYQLLGLEVHFTEVDVRIKTPVTQTKLDHQAEIYAALMQMVLDHYSVNTFITWGVTDKYSWIPNYFAGYDSSLMFDSQYQPKPAYDSVINLLQ